MLCKFATIRSMVDHIAIAYPQLAQYLPKIELANLPTPVVERQLQAGSRAHNVTVKCDDLSSDLYGGNKIRKLEYLLQRATAKNAQRIATFGTVASNHAIATAVHAKSLGFECTCLLSNQTCTPSVPRALNLHMQNGTEVIRYGGARSSRIRILREHLWNRGVFLIPPGGSNWLGAVGFVNAGLELAAQVARGEVPMPDRLYVANGTMATAVGIALGLALAAFPTEVQAIRVTENFVSNPAAMRRMLVKTATVLNSLDDSVPVDLADRARYCFRDEYLGDGYAKTNATTDHAIDVARDELGLTLDATYTGKAMAALLDDMQKPECAGQSLMFWNTYNSQPLPVGSERPDDVSRLPPEFLRYYD